jgi:hypothetical protein
MNWIDKSRLRHGSRYDYSRAVYTGVSKKVEIVCPEHGSFWQTPGNHYSGKGCKICGQVSAREKQKMDVDEFIEKSKRIHGDYYAYSLVDYTNAKTLVMIICPTHGVFEQTPDAHLQGKSCLQCSYDVRGMNKRSTLTDYLRKFNTEHGSRYDYSNSRYETNTTPISIGCSIHGEFFQIPTVHAAGMGCPKCSRFDAKKANSWLDKLKVPNDCAHREVRGLVKSRRYTVDGYDPATKTVYEFHGDYWHGNPKIYDGCAVNTVVGKTFGQLYEATLEKRSIFETEGYQWIEIWESDYDSSDIPLPI